MEKAPNGAILPDRFPRLKEIPSDRYPDHVLIVPGRNITFARKIFARSPIFGHKRGTAVIYE